VRTCVYMCACVCVCCNYYLNVFDVQLLTYTYMNMRTVVQRSHLLHKKYRAWPVMLTYLN